MKYSEKLEKAQCPLVDGWLNYVQSHNEDAVRNVIGADMGRCLHLVRWKNTHAGYGYMDVGLHVCVRLYSRKRFQRTCAKLMGVFCRVVWEAVHEGTFTFLLCVFI